MPRRLPKPSRKKPWPQEFAEDYYILKTQLDKTIRLVERSSSLAAYRNRAYLQKAVPMIHMIARRMIQSGVRIAAWQRSGDFSGGYWINDVLTSTEYFPPAIAKWAKEIEVLLETQSWPRIEERLSACLDAAYRILLGYNAEDGKWKDGLMTGVPPEEDTSTPIDDSLFQDIEFFLSLNPQFPPPENKIKNMRQQTKFTVKRKRRVRVRHGNGKEAKEGKGKG